MLYFKTNKKSKENIDGYLIGEGVSFELIQYYNGLVCPRPKLNKFAVHFLFDFIGFIKTPFSKMFDLSQIKTGENSIETIVWEIPEECSSMVIKIDKFSKNIKFSPAIIHFDKTKQKTIESKKRNMKLKINFQYFGENIYLEDIPQIKILFYSAYFIKYY